MSSEEECNKKPLSFEGKNSVVRKKNLMVFKVAINCQQPDGKRTWATSYTTAPSHLIVVKATCIYCNAPQLQGNRSSC